jgi:hypothetical protein
MKTRATYRPATKLAPCPSCCPAPGRACFRADEVYVEASERGPEGDKFVKVWVCENCRHELPRRTISRAQRTEATPAQKEALERWLRRNLSTYSADSDLHDVVQPGTEKIEFQGRAMIWSGTIGPKSRKGCLSLCDKLYLLKFGPNGGVEVLYKS